MTFPVASTVIGLVPNTWLPSVPCAVAEPYASFASEQPSPSESRSSWFGIPSPSKSQTRLDVSKELLKSVAANWKPLAASTGNQAVDDPKVY